MPERLNFEERTTLLKLARQSLINAANDRPAPPLPKDLPAALLEEGASFVTLTVSGCAAALAPSGVSTVSP